MSTCSNISLISSSSSSSSSLLSSSTISSFSEPSSKYVPRDVSWVVRSGKALEKCQSPGSMKPGAYEVTTSMFPKMTPEQFDELTAQDPEYELSYGGRCGWTALKVALTEGYPLLLIIHILDRAPALVNKGMGDFPTTPLMVSCSTNDFVTSLKMVKLFIKRGAKINLSNNVSETALFLAAEHGNMDVMKYLILRGGVIYQHCLDESAKPCYSEECRESASRVLPNLARAIEELWGAQCFKNGTLHSSRSDSSVSRIPEELRLKIASFVED